MIIGQILEVLGLANRSNFIEFHKKGVVIGQIAPGLFSGRPLKLASDMRCREKWREKWLGVVCLCGCV